ncbi:hypothetical protein K440DRAFT_641357 [Wilcoxina mikolae CBS 423.85]|nr:hypothetical protein K440DRAFT_641357 [Wilcoxina mikolae CBS 423.85]
MIAHTHTLTKKYASTSNSVTTHSPAIPGSLSPQQTSRSDRTPQKTGTILPPEVTQFDDNNLQPWPSQSPRQRHSPQISTTPDSTPPQPHVNSPTLPVHFDPAPRSPSSLGNDFVLFPASAPHPPPRPIPSGRHHSTSSSSLQPRRVSEIVNGLGYSISSSSFSHRSTAPASSYTSSHPPDIIYRQSDSAPSHTSSHQSPILDPIVAAKYYRKPLQDFTSHGSSMTQGNNMPPASYSPLASNQMIDTSSSDQMKAGEPEVWGEDMWAHELLAGSEFSPNINGQDICTGTTISPSDIHMNPTHSVHSSPFLFDSPSEGYETSPLFGGEDVSEQTEWFSLFPDAKPEPDVPQPSATALQSDVAQNSRDSTESPDTSPRFRSTSKDQKRSSTSGIRKRTAPLPPIVVEDPSDTVAMKRARNTLAARKSRAKKAEKMDEMEEMIERLKAEVEHWRSIALSK